MLVSIIIPHKLRSRVKMEDGSVLSLFPNCIDSIANTTSGFGVDFELVVADFGSQDYPLSEWLTQDRAQMPVTILDKSDDPVFNRGKGLNTAARAASGDVYCLMDTDMLLSREFWMYGIHSIKNNKAFFPVCYSFKDPAHKTGWWRNTGYGMSMVKKEWYWQVSGVKEIPRWGTEDNLFVQGISKIVPIYRPQVANYFHQWHPNGNDWKNKHIS